MMKRTLTLAAFAAVAAGAHAQVIYTENFSTDVTANWNYYGSITGDTASIGDLGGTADFFFDYSTVGIPVAPNGTDTHGLKMQANVVGTGVFSGMSVVLQTQSFTGDYTLRFDAWQNIIGPLPAGGSGSTQITGAGIGGSNVSQWIGSPMSGVSVYATGDGGSASDYRMYNQTAGAIVGTYAAGSQNNSNAYYAGFQGTVPAAQTAWANGQGFLNQTGSTQVGALGMAWHRWEVAKVGSTVTWTVDGLLIATLTNATFSGDQLFFAHSDINATSSTDPFSNLSSFGLIDNVQVEAVPEPATLAVLGLAAAAALRRRKK